MATIAPVQILLEKCLRTSYHPDCDFVAGELEERHFGEQPHSKLQLEIGFWLRLHNREWQIVPMTEQRIRVAENRVRICDVCALRADAPYEDVVATAPLLCIEILSPEDRVSGAISVLADYRRMGVKVSWLFDPIKRLVYVFDHEGLHEFSGDRLELAETPIYVNLPDLFSILNKQ